jgi:gluconate:H+ symporter, GntP family
MSVFYISFLLISAILAIILLSAKWKFNTFFVLLVVATIVGFAAGMDGDFIIKSLKTGFGSTLEKIGLLIIFGTTLGVLLEKTNATVSLAHYILSKTGENRAPIAVLLMGFLIGLPIFCDSGFVVLIGLVMSLVARMPRFHVALVVILATSLISVHCLVPPHPGITAAAGILKVDIGKAILLGSILAIPPAIAGYFWAKYINRKLNLTYDFSLKTIDNQIDTHNLPAPLLSFLPIIIPIFLISLKSIVLLKSEMLAPAVLKALSFIGEPMIALFIGILTTLPLINNMPRPQLNWLFDAAIDKSGSILAVTAAGGAFGEIIKGLDLGKTYGDMFAASGLGLFIPFALAAVFKMAQGSSTVAVISTAGIIAPLLPSLGFSTEGGQLLALMAAGAGSLVFSHTNDSYFWVISKFSNLDVNTTLKAHSSATAIMGFVALISVYIASFFIL